MEVFRQTCVYLLRTRENVGQEVLLQLKSKGENKNYWGGVGGHLKDKELPFTCAIRETREETGLEMHNVMHNGKLIVNNSQMTRMYHIDFFSSWIHIGFMKGNDEGQLHWFKTHELPYSMMLPANRVVINHILEGATFGGVIMVADGQKLENYTLNVEGILRR
jgi:8-oxo-dGTP diphosphatase